MNTTQHRLPIRRRGRKWQLDARRIGGQQTTYDTKAQAEGAAQALWDDKQARETESLDFTMERRRIAAAAFHELKDYPETDLIEAAKFYAKNIPAAALRRTVREVCAEYLKSLSGTVAAVTMANDYEPKFRPAGKFVTAFGERDLSTVTPSDLENWLDGEGVAPLYRETWRNRLATMWRFAIERNYAKQNSAAAVKRLSRQLRKKLKSHPPAILNADELRALMTAAAEYRHGVMVPYFAVCAVAGLRPDEAKRIGWENVSFADNEIRVPAEASKTGDPREVTMTPGLVAWLQVVPAFRRTGLFSWSRAMFEEVRKRAGLDARWREPKGADILRHSAASHHYRLHGNMELTAAAMGHDVLVFKSHYKALVATKDEAAAYFNVLPPSTATVIDFNRVAV